MKEVGVESECDVVKVEGVDITATGERGMREVERARMHHATTVVHR